MLESMKQTPHVLREREKSAAGPQTPLNPQPLVSVLVAAHNHEAFVGECLRSVLAQTYSRFECLVVDDGSSDATAAACEAVAVTDPRMHFSRQANAGAGATVSQLLRRASGEYIALLDSDDVWYPEKLHVQLALLQERPDLAGAFAHVNIVDALGEPCDALGDVFCAPTDPERLVRALAVRNRLCTTTAVLRRQTVVTLGDLADDLPYVQDYDYWLRAICLGPLGVVDRPLASYRVHGNNLSLGRERLSCRDTWRALKRNHPRLLAHFPYLAEERTNMLTTLADLSFRGEMWIESIVHHAAKLRHAGLEIREITRLHDALVAIGDHQRAQQCLTLLPQRDGGAAPNNLPRAQSSGQNSVDFLDATHKVAGTQSGPSADPYSVGPAIHGPRETTMTAFPAAPQTPASLDVAELQRLWWYYTVELAPGRFAKGQYPDHRPLLPRMLLRNCGIRGMRCLDLGAMEGLLSVVMCRQGAESVLATDYSEHCVRKMQAVADAYDADFSFRAVGLMYDLHQKLQGESFDLINCSGLLYHVFSPMSVLAGVRPLVRRNGLMIVATNVLLQAASVMAFNDAGRLQLESNTFWYMAVPLLEYTLRYLQLTPIDMIYTPNHGLTAHGWKSQTASDRESAYMAVVCRATDTAAADPWMLESRKKSWEYQDVGDWSVANHQARSSIAYRGVKSEPAIDLWMETQRRASVPSQVGIDDSNFLRLAAEY